jgi:uncharacterized protein with von Willebrand factor type A (vWA) domain
MDRDSALVSPQFHVAFDTTFNTVKGIRTRSSWQVKAGFVTTQKESEKRTTAPTAPASSDGRTGKRKRNASNKVGKAGEPDPSNQKEPAAAPVGDDGPPISSVTENGNEVTGEETERRLPKRTSRYGRILKPIHKTLEAMRVELSEVTRNDVEGEIFCYETMFPDDDFTVIPRSAVPEGQTILPAVWQMRRKRDA